MGDFWEIFLPHRSLTNKNKFYSCLAILFTSDRKINREVFLYHKQQYKGNNKQQEMLGTCFNEELMPT